jgi:hypothetical protein
LNPETCPECNRLRQELSEITEKIFLLEQRLRRAELREDEEQVKAVSGSLTSLVDAQRRLSQEMTEHIGQAHSTR